MELPVKGYPISAEAVTKWFRSRDGARVRARHDKVARMADA